MNNKKVFSFHMFLQTLKQTRLAGFIMMAVITLISVVPIISSLSYIKEYKQVNNVGGISGNYFLVLVFIIVVPVISLIVWSFLNKRSGSDFYHSIPYTRLCIYLSKTAAILTWIAGILVVSYVSQAVLFMANRQYFNVDYDAAGSIGKRYRREDEIGTPFCICVDFDTPEDKCVTIRDRDTMEQVRIPVDQVRSYIEERLIF